MDKRKLAIAAIIGLIVLAIIIGLSIGLTKNDNDSSSEKATAPKKDKVVYFTKGAVATDAEECSKIGRDVLVEGGHAVDAAIASLICCGVVNFHSTGIGGGGFMTVYDRNTKTSRVYDYREYGPASLTATTYNNDTTKKNLVGGLAVGVPAELRGLKKAHDDYGKLNWTRLIQPSIDLAENGTRIGKHMFANMKSSSTGPLIEKDAGLRELLFFKNGTMKGIGDIVVNKKYAETLRKIQKNPDDLHTGNLSNVFIKDVNDNGGNMTADDLKNYTVLIKDTVLNKLNDKLTLHTTPLPGGGSVLVHILNMIQGFNFSKADEKELEKKILTYHRLIETFKFSYAIRPHLGDPDKVPQANKTQFDKSKADILSKEVAKEHRLMINDSSTQKNSYYDPYFTEVEDSGTTHVSVLDEDGNAVSATDTINYAFGAKFRSMTSGIIYNNELADYFIDTSYEKYPRPIANAPGPGRRPLSSTCPSIITDNNGDVVMVVGASGGTRITLSTAWVIMKKLWFGYSLSDAIEDARAQHTFFPNYVRNEKGVPLPKNILDGLKKKNHVVKDSRLNAIVQGIFVEDKKIYAKSDPRKEGKAAGY